MFESEARIDLASLPLPERVTVGFLLMRTRSEAMRIVLHNFLVAACTGQAWQDILARTLEATLAQIGRDSFGEATPEDLQAAREAVANEAIKIIADIQ